VVIGFLGALVGVLLDHTERVISTSFDPMTVAALLLLGIVLATGASALTALPASGEKPLTVLRYE
jgi:ABC-type lipoprotein release transport system permease subunit